MCEKFLYLYADESGHTGKNIFSEPRYFYQGAILAEEDGDELFEGIVSEFCEKNRTDRIHAKDNTVDVNVAIAKQALDILNGLDWFFHLCRIDKPYMLPAKFVECVFDPGLNDKVPEHWYWHEFYRHQLCCLFDDVFTEQDRVNFWDSFCSGEINSVRGLISRLKRRLRRYINPRSEIYDVALDGLNFMFYHTDQLDYSDNGRRHGYKPQTPNMVGFTTLFDAINKFHKEFNAKPVAICHDNQREFKKTMEEYVEKFGGLVIPESDDGLPRTFEHAGYDLDELCMPKSQDSSGLQIVDVFMWLLQRDEARENEVVKEIVENMSSTLYIGRPVSQALVMGWGKKFNEYGYL